MAIIETAPPQSDEIPNQPTTPEIRNRRGRRIAALALTTTLVVVGVGGALAALKGNKKQIANKEQLAHPNNQSGNETHNQEQTILSDNVKSATSIKGETTSNGEKQVSAEIKQRLQRSAIKIFRQPKDGSQAPYLWCDGNVVTSSQNVMIQTGEHCVDQDKNGTQYGIQNAYAGTKGTSAAMDISGMIPFKFFVYNHGEEDGSGAPQAEIGPIVIDISNKHNGLALMKPKVITPELKDRAIDISSSRSPKPGEEIYFIGSPATSGINTKDISLKYIGDSTQYIGETYNNATAPHYLARPVIAPGTSGGAGIMADGTLTGPLKAMLISGKNGGDAENGYSPQEEDSWRADAENQMGVPIGEANDNVQLTDMDPAVIAAEVQALNGSARTS